MHYCHMCRAMRAIVAYLGGTRHQLECKHIVELPRNVAR